MAHVWLVESEVKGFWSPVGELHSTRDEARVEMRWYRRFKRGTYRTRKYIREKGGRG